MMIDSGVSVEQVPEKRICFLNRKVRLVYTFLINTRVL
jgi:hypothetical protein